MDIFFTCLFIGISLSMDAFSLSLIYGTYGFSLRNQLLLSFIVGCFHFFMPLVGLLFGGRLFKFFAFNSNLIVGFIFCIIGIEMFFSIGKDDNVRVISSVWEFFIFGFTVSVDSLTTGIGLSAITYRYYMACFIFMVFSGSFTYFGLSIGKKVSDRWGKMAVLFGSFLMIVLGSKYIINFFYL